VAQDSSIPRPVRQNRGFILGSLSIGHGVSHVFDLGFPVLMPAIATAMGLGNLQVAALLSIRQGGSGAVSLGGGVFVDAWKRHWGPILTGCMVWTAAAFLLIAVSRNYPQLVIGMVLVSIPGALWHLPSSAAISQRFPDRRGFALSLHGFGSNIGNVSGPLLAGLLLTWFFWRKVLLLYSGPAVLFGLLVWWSLKDLGRDGAEAASSESLTHGGEPAVSGLKQQFRESARLLKNPVVLGLVLTATLRGIGLNATFHWAPFYLEKELGMGHFQAGVHFALLTGMGIVSAPVLGALSDRFGRKRVLLPGLILASVFSLLVAVSGGTIFLALMLAGLGLFSFALHQIIQAAVLDVVGRGTEATAIGLIFGINGVLGGVSPFLSLLVINHLGGYGSIFYYAGALTALSAVLVMLIPLRPVR
jgi:FSR family fosmidomycin resistance protein-like MFS transporter